MNYSMEMKAEDWTAKVLLLIIGVLISADLAVRCNKPLRGAAYLLSKVDSLRRKFNGKKKEIR